MKKERLREARDYSLGLTEQMWKSLGVPESATTALPADSSVGDILKEPKPGMNVVVGVQGSGKTLAVSRQFQNAFNRALADFSMPYPLYVEAGNLQKPLSSYLI